MTVDLDRPLPEVEELDWAVLLAPLDATHAARVSVGRGWDPDHEERELAGARAEGRDLLSVRLYRDEVVIGPLWRRGAGESASCAGCAEHHQRVVAAHPLRSRLAQRTAAAPAGSPLLAEVAAAAVAHLQDLPLERGEALVAGSDGVRRHRVRPAPDCPLGCGPVPVEEQDRRPPAAPTLVPLELDADDASRGLRGRTLLRPGWLRREVVDTRFGPVGEAMRESRAPFAMSMAYLPDAVAMGYGRAEDFATAESTAVLEAFERQAGFPHEAAVLTDVAYDQVAERALDPRRLGGYTAEQLARPERQMEGFAPEAPMDWVWAHRLHDGEARLVPAEIGFYQYDHLYRGDRWAARDGLRGPRRHVFHETSSGCALGGSATEAAVHSLLELAERDAFLLSWHAAEPLARLDPATVANRTSHRLMGVLRARGFETHLLRATRDIDVPVVWAMAVNTERAFPATYSAAGSGLDPEKAVLAALWELTQVASDPVRWDLDDLAPLLDDPWRVATMDDHLRLYTHPATVPRVATVLGGPVLGLADAFPGFPGPFRARTSDLRETLSLLEERYVRAGLDEILLVDQSTRVHRDLDVAVVKAVVPGIAPMCFGHAQQRLDGLARVEAAVSRGRRPDRTAPYDPHPFP